MNITDELIKKYFHRKCTREEHAAVNKYFQRHPEMLDKYLDEEDFVNNEEGEKLDPVFSAHMLDNIEHSIHVNKAKSRKNIIYMISATAACMLICLGLLFWMQLNSRPGPQDNITSVIKAQKMDTVVNQNRHACIIHLHDGSTITLAPQSQIIYQQEFTQKERNIYLSGEAVFDVAKDKNRPFTVFAGELSTTAIGTSFKVIALRNSTKTLIELYTGKVSVKKHSGRTDKLLNETILIPGQQFVLNKDSNTGHVSNMTDTVYAAALANEDANDVYWINGHTIKFNNHPLDDVLKVMQQAYHIQIKTNPAQLSGKYFTGVIDIRKKSSDETLRTIAMLNELTISKDKEGYVLSR